MRLRERGGQTNSAQPLTPPTLLNSGGLSVRRRRLRSFGGGLGPGDEEFAFAGIAGEGSGTLEFFAGFGVAAEFEEEIAADAGQEMVVPESGISGKSVDEREAGGGPGSHGHGDGAIEFNNGRRREAGKLFVESGDARPIGFFGSASARVACGDGRLQSVRSQIGGGFFGAVESGESAADEELIPKAAILVQKQNGLAVCGGARGKARSLDFHERDKAVDFRFAGRELGENAAEAQGVFTKGRTHPVVAGSGRVAFVENQVDDFEDRKETRGEVGAAGNLEGNAGFAEGALGTDDALGDGRLWNEKGAGDFVCSEAAEKAESERDARFRRKNRVTGDEDEAKEIVANVVVESGFDLHRGGLLLDFEFAAELFVLAFEELVAAKMIDGAIFGSGHEPSAGIIGNARFGPLFQRGNEGVLREFFGSADVAGDARQASDNAGGLHSPDGFDDAVNGSVMDLQGGHRHPSHH